MYAGAGHAYNLDESNRISILHWPDRLADWMADEGPARWSAGPAAMINPPAACTCATSSETPAISSQAVIG